MSKFKLYRADHKKYLQQSMDCVAAILQGKAHSSPLKLITHSSPGEGAHAFEIHAGRALCIKIFSTLHQGRWHHDAKFESKQQELGWLFDV